ncbi:MAG: hypothetical protein ACRDJW_24470 [Thermomicrobiales bacterium]
MDDSTKRSDMKQARGRIRRLPLALATLLIVLASAGLVAARQVARFDESPATGHAQVVAQGIADLPDEPVVWRLVERTAEPRGAARFGDRVLGFVLATDEPVLLTDETAGGPVDVARIAPGEAYLVQSGARQMRWSLSGQRVNYLALELVPAAIADQVGGGTVLYQTPPFDPATGQRDVDLVRDVLAFQESTVIRDSGQPVVIFASEGAVEVVPSIGRTRTLQPGEVGIFEGELAITAMSATSANASRIPLAAFTQSHQATRATAGAAFVAGVIGPEIPPVPTPTPAIPQPPVEPVPSATPSASPTRPTEPDPEPTATTDRPDRSTPTPRPPVIVIPTFITPTPTAEAAP